MAVKWKESEKRLKAMLEEVSSVKEEMAPVDSEKARANKIIIATREVSEQRTLRLNAAFASPSLAKNRMRSLLNESWNSVYASVQELRKDAVIRLRERLQMK